jgi:hypothetical protein
MLSQEEKTEFCKARGYSAAYCAYWCEHVGCECRCTAPSEPPHHLRTRGAHGNIDEAWNLVAACLLHHRMFHTVGGIRMAQLFPHLKEKIIAARTHPIDRRGKIK